MRLPEALNSVCYLALLLKNHTIPVWEEMLGHINLILVTDGLLLSSLGFFHFSSQKLASGSFPTYPFPDPRSQTSEFRDFKLC